MGKFYLKRWLIIYLANGIIMYLSSLLVIETFYNDTVGD